MSEILLHLVQTYQGRQSPQTVPPCRTGIRPGQKVSCSERFYDDLQAGSLRFAIGNHVCRCKERWDNTNQPLTGLRQIVVPLLGLASGFLIALGLPSTSLGNNLKGMCAQETRKYPDGKIEHSVCPPCC